MSLSRGIEKPENKYWFSRSTNILHMTKQQRVMEMEMRREKREGGLERNLRRGRSNPFKWVYQTGILDTMDE